MLPRLRQLRQRLFSPTYSNGRWLLTAIALMIVAAYSGMVLHRIGSWIMAPQLSLLTDPFLQLPTANSVRVVWFTEFAGDRHWVDYGTDLQHTVDAVTRPLSRLREDAKSRVGEQGEDGQVYRQPTPRRIWRHEAEIPDLVPGQRYPYRVTSQPAEGRLVQSQEFTLAARPNPGQPLTLLLTSDHQLKPMTAANLQKVVETARAVDAVLLAGDLVDIPDRASEWFDDRRGGAFFPSLQGRATYALEQEGQTTVYHGGALIQSAPLFPAFGNHEVMGRFSTDTSLADQFNDPVPRAVAVQRYLAQSATVNPTGNPAIAAEWIRDHSFNTVTVEELFTLPANASGGERYYALTYGDVRLVSLFATQIWRVPFLDPDARGRYRERDGDLDHPDRWGYGQHIFEPIAVGSPQYEWLRQELASPAFQQAKYKIVMLHHPPHSLGDNIVPAYTNPVQLIDWDDQGQIRSVRYEYPLEQDYLIRDVMPLLEQAGVQLVFYGHSHLWNRFVSPGGMHFLETSNVGNTYGAYVDGQRRAVPLGFDQTYVATGDPNGLAPVMPTLAPLEDDQGQPLPYVASNDITAFSLLDTATGLVSSYRFDTREPDSAVVKFDEFSLQPR